MLIQEIDAIVLQPAQRPFDRLANASGLAVHARHLVIHDVETKLRRNDDPIVRNTTGTSVICSSVQENSSTPRPLMRRR